MTKTRKAHLGVELLEDRLVQSTFSYMSLTASPSLSTVTAAEATYDSSITAVDISANDVTPVQLVQPMDADANALTPVEGFQPLIDIGDPLPGSPPATGGIDIQAFDRTARFEQGRLAIDARLGEAKAGEVFGTALAAADSVDSGNGVRRDFTKGSMFWSPETGAHFVSKAVMWKYDRMDHAYIYPTADTKQLAGWQSGSPRGPGAATYNDFHATQKKVYLTIVSSPGNVSVIDGMIRDKWIALGSGRFGVPLNEAGNDYGGRIQDFWFRGFSRGAIQFDVDRNLIGHDRDLAAITWHKDVGAHVVFARSEKWSVGHYHQWAMSGRASAYEAGAWGFPATDEFYVDARGNPEHAGTVHFVNPNRQSVMATFNYARDYVVEGRIVSVKDLVVRDGIYREWMARGAENFGLPTENAKDHGGYLEQTFKTYYYNGQSVERQIVWHKGDGRTEAFINTIDGWLALPRSQGSGLTVEEPLFTSDPSAIESLVSHRAPVIIDSAVVINTTSFIDAWGAHLSRAVEPGVHLFGEEWNGMTLDAANVVEDGIWFASPAPERESTEESPSANELPEEPVSEEAIAEVFAGELTDEF